jgi:hypothetical protein
VPLFPPQIPDDLAWERTSVSRWKAVVRPVSLG